MLFLVLDCKHLIIFDTEFEQVYGYFRTEFINAFIEFFELMKIFLQTHWYCLSDVSFVISVKRENIIDEFDNSIRIDRINR